MNGVPPTVTLDLHKNAEISKIIADGIRAAEALEESVTKNASHLMNNQEIFPRYPTIGDGYRQQPVYGPGPYLRPPQGMRPHRRPPPPSMMRDRPQRPPPGFILPQPGMLVNHYKTPMQKIQGPFRKMIKPRPMPPGGIPGVLLLGETSELHVVKKSTDNYLKSSQPIQKPISVAQKPIQTPEIMSKVPKPIDLPYNLNTKEALQQKPILVPKAERLRQEKPIAKISAYKPPFELRKDRFPVRQMVGLHDGFKPESLVVEGGFRPIVRRRDEAESRSDDREALFERTHDDSRERDLDIEEVIENDSAFMKSLEKENEQFEPMFKPSPLDSVSVEAAKKEAQRREDKLTGDLKEMNVEDGDDKIAMAAENYETLYLPPVPSSFEYPEGSVVTFDGKAVLDASLVVGKPPQTKEARKHTGTTGSKLEALIRDKPQFGPFRGEIPPLPEFISYDTSSVINPLIKNVPEYSHQSTPNVAHPGLGTEEQQVVNKPISTKLTIVKAEPEQESRGHREKRAAHHHPDHHDDEHDHHDHSHHATGSTSDLHELSNSLFTAAVTFLIVSLQSRYWLR